MLMVFVVVIAKKARALSHVPRGLAGARAGIGNIGILEVEQS